jgi:hypothetical protein
MSNYGVIAAIAILCIIIAIIVINFNTKDNKKAAKLFLQGLADEMTALALNIIQGFNPSDYESIEEFELSILNTIYDKLFDYVLHEIENSEDVGSITKAIAKQINKNAVVAFIDDLFNKEDILDVMRCQFSGEAIPAELIETEDKALEEQFNSDEYNEEEISKSNLPSGESELTDEEKEQIAALNPQTDDEKELIPDEDDSVEYEDEFKEVKPEIVKKVNKAGKVMYYEIIDGKKHQVSKDYASRFLSPEEM